MAQNQEGRDCHPAHSRSLIWMLLPMTYLTPETALQAANDVFNSGTCAAVQTRRMSVHADAAEESSS